jgi:hypothetical protein
MNFATARRTQQSEWEFQPAGKSGLATQNVQEGEIAAFQESAICLQPQSAKRFICFWLSAHGGDGD